MESDTAVIIVARVEDLATPTPNATVRHCALCKKAVWFSETTERSVRPRPFKLHCWPCEKGKVPVNAVFQPLSEEQREEIAAATGLTDDEISVVEAMGQRLARRKETG